MNRIKPHTECKDRERAMNKLIFGELKDQIQAVRNSAGAVCDLTCDNQADQRWEVKQLESVADELAALSDQIDSLFSEANSELDTILRHEHQFLNSDQSEDWEA